MSDKLDILLQALLHILFINCSNYLLFFKTAEGRLNPSSEVRGPFSRGKEVKDFDSIHIEASSK